MRYQFPPHAEIKMVTCLKGEVWDVAVDLRQGSPMFLEWRGEVLTESNNATTLWYGTRLCFDLSLEHRFGD